MRRLCLTLFLCVPFIAFAQNRSSDGASAPAVRFTEKSVIGSGFSPDSTVIFFGVGLRPNGYDATVLEWSQAIQGSHDGSAEFVSDAAIPCNSVWVAVSTKDARYAIGAPPGCAVRSISAAARPFHKSGGGNVDLFGHDHPSVDLLYVHPGLGAWTGFAFDGTETDADGVPNGNAMVRLSKLTAIGGAAAPPAAFAPGGVLFALDYHTVDIAVVRIDGAALKEVQ